MKNQIYTGTPTSRRFSLLPTTVKAGDALLLGKEPAVAMDDYQAVSGGATCMTGGSFTLTVEGNTSLSPTTPGALKPGDKVYAFGGTLDATTNVTTAFTLCGDSVYGVLFGFIDPSYAAGVTSGATNTATTVRLQGAE